jgi:hypothetical protein
MKWVLFLSALLSVTASAESSDLAEIEAEIDAEVAAAAPSNEDIRILNSEPITIDGYVKEASPTDQELVEIRQEINRQKKEAALNKVKAKQFQELSKSTEILTETTVEMLEEKRAVQEQIAEYNEKVRCLQLEKPTPECSKYIKRR